MQMFLRTDLAIEAHSAQNGRVAGVNIKTRKENEIKITQMEIKTEQAARKLGKAVGKYITIELGSIADGLAETDGAASLIASEISRLAGNFSTALVIGIGNPNLTADALGPKTANGILATRHIKKEFAESIGLCGLKNVAVLSPGVLGKTGMEVVEIIKSVCEIVSPDIIIAVDALAAADNSRLGTTVQINDCGFSPGSGIGNKRKEISENTLGVKVIALGVPTVANLPESQEQFIVTLRDIDLLTQRAAELLSHSINFALQPNIEREVLLSLI